MKNLFVITSPLQYLNALEARRHYQIDPTSTVLVIIGNRQGEESIRQLRKLLIGATWGEIVFGSGLPPRVVLERSRLLRFIQNFFGALTFRRQMDALLARLPDVERIFLGDWRARSFRYFLSRRPHSPVFLLDDGSVTSQAFRFRNDPRDPQVEPKAFPSSIPPAWLSAGLHFHDPARITFFTCYDLPCGRRDDVERHSFEALKSGSESWTPSDDVWFIGSNHSENGITSERSYLATMQEVRRFFSDRHLRYFAHRGESAKKLAQLEGLGFAVTQSELPLEVVIREQKTYPRLLGAIASSVVDNLAAILGARVAVFLFIVPPAYYRSRARHLADIVRYHLEASGGNLFAIHLDLPSGTPLAPPTGSSAGTKVPSSLHAYEHLTRQYASVSAYGAHSTHARQPALKVSFSGVTFQASQTKNTSFKTFLRDSSFQFDIPLEPTWTGSRTTPVLRSAPCPAASGRRHWILFEGPSQNLLCDDVILAEARGSSLEPVSAAHDIVSPGGTSGAIRFAEDTTTGPHAIALRASELAIGADHHFSIYVKRAGRERVILRAQSPTHETWAGFN